MNKDLLYYLLISFGVCWIGAGLIPLFDIGYNSFASTAIVALICMPAPALAAWIVQVFILKRPFAELQLTWKQADQKQLYLLPVWLFVFLLATVGWIYLLGNVFQIEVFGLVDFSRDGLLLKLEEVTQGKTDLSTVGIPSPWIVFALICFAAILTGSSINLIFTLGEEIGWRGFLYKQFEHFSPAKRSMITGTIWGIWHAPLIVLGLNYPDHPYLGIGMMVVFCVALSFPMDFLRRSTNTILGPGAFHGLINASAAGTMLFIWNGDSLIASIAGLSGALAAFSLLGIQYLLTKIINR